MYKINPTELGFVMRDDGNVDIPAMSGRYDRVPVGNPDDLLTRGVVKGVNGGDVPVKGPVDLVGWARMQGGLRDSGGELRNMGIDNRARTGMEFVGQEAKFGPMVSDDGMDFDEAAQSAWEAGYFPELSERPDVNTFLNALRDTYDNNTGRRFLMDDVPEVEAYRAAQDQAWTAREARTNEAPLYTDNSTDAGMPPVTPMAAYGEEMPLPTVRTLDLVKRAMDEVIEDGNKNPITGLPLPNLSFTAKAQQNARERFVKEVDKLVPDYKDARAASAPFLQARSAVDQGANILNRGLRPEDVVAYDRRLGDVGKEAYRLGATRALYDSVQNVSDNRNPYASIFGRPQIRDNLNYLFPDGSRTFSQIVDAEKDMAATAQEIAGGSQTAQRMMTDQALNPENMGTGIMLDIAGGGGAVTANNLRRPIMNAVKDRMAVGMGEAGRRRASEIAPYLLDPIDPNTLQNIQLYAQQRARRRAQASQLGGLFGASFPGAVLGGE